MEGVGVASGPGVGCGPSVDAGDPRLNELNELALLARVEPSVGGAGGGAGAWLRGIAAARSGCLPRAIVGVKYGEAERCKMSIPERFPNGLIEPLGESF